MFFHLNLRIDLITGLLQLTVQKMGRSLRYAIFKRGDTLSEQYQASLRYDYLDFRVSSDNSQIDCSHTYSRIDLFRQIKTLAQQLSDQVNGINPSKEPGRINDPAIGHFIEALAVYQHLMLVLKDDDYSILIKYD
jgi:hypothetical protein